MLCDFIKGGHENIGISMLHLEFIELFKKSLIYRPLKNKRNKERPNAYLQCRMKRKKKKKKETANASTSRLNL